MIIGAIRKDLGIGYVIENLKDNELEVLPIKEELPIVDIMIVYNKNYLTTSSVKFMKEYIKDFNSEL